jgi:hypothetical protein
MNMAWALGQMVGAGGGGALAKAAGDALPMLGLAGLAVLTLVALGVRHGGARGAAVREPAPP